MRYAWAMHVISRKALSQFWEKFPDSKTALTHWFKVVQQTEFHNFTELRAAFPAADKVDGWIVFNIGGNRIATPFLQDSFILYFMPVYPGALSVPGFRPI